MTDNIKEMPQPRFTSESSVVELVRGMIDVAVDKRITYLEINYKTKGDPTLRSCSIVTKDDHGID